MIASLWLPLPEPPVWMLFVLPAAAAVLVVRETVSLRREMRRCEQFRALIEQGDFAELQARMTPEELENVNVRWARWWLGKSR